MKKLALYIFLLSLIMAITFGSLVMPRQSAYADAANAPLMMITRTPIAPL